VKIDKCTRNGPSRKISEADRSLVRALRVVSAGSLLVILYVWIFWLSAIEELYAIEGSPGADIGTGASDSSFDGG